MPSIVSRDTIPLWTASRPRHVSECYFRKHFARNFLSSLCTSGALLSLPEFLPGEKAGVIITVDMVEKGTVVFSFIPSTRGRHVTSRKDEENGLTTLVLLLLRDIMLHSFFPPSLIHRETASMRNYWQDILAKHDEWSFFQNPTPVENGQNGHSLAADQTWNSLFVI